MLSKTSVNSAKFGEGTNIKQWLTDNKDFSVANTLKISQLRLKDIQENTAIKPNLSKSKGSKKKDVTEDVKLGILQQLDLNNAEISKTNKLYKSL